jgi:uncharacterized protein YhjY with autotransporter beta-barrel domain
MQRGLGRAWGCLALAAGLLLPAAASATLAQYNTTCGTSGGCHASPPDAGRRNAAEQASFITWAVGGGVPAMAGVDTTNAASIATYIESVYNTNPIAVPVPFQTATAIDLSPYVMFGQTSGLDRFVYAGLAASEGTVSPASNVPTATESITFTPAACRTGAASFTYHATNGSGNPVTSNRTINVTIGSPTSGLAVGGAATASGVTGQVFTTYSTSATCPLLVTGYTIVGTALPAGLTLNGSGQIVGTPTAVTPPGGTAITIRTTYAPGVFTDKVVTITITLGPPSITSGAPVSGIEGNAYSHTVVATNGPNTFTLTSGTLPPGLLLNAATGVVSGTLGATADPPFSAASINYPVRITATNATGSDFQDMTFTIGARPVVNNVTLTASGQTGVPFSYQITATKTPTGFGAIGLPPGLSVSPTGLISGTPTVVGGPTNVTISASNAFGSGPGATLAITIGLGPPVITSGAMPSGGELVPYPGYTITATNPPHTSYNATGLPAGLTVNPSTGVISGTPAAATGGSHAVTVFATNATGTGSAPFTLVISSVPPVINSAASASGQTGVAFSYQITALNAPTSFSAANLPPGVAINPSTGLISGTPTAVGTFNATMTATNGSGSDLNKPLTITITLGPPVVTSGATASGAAGFPFSYQIAATNSPTSFAATGLPPGVTVNTATGLISGTPTANGVYNATVSATNATATASRAVTITIAFGLPVITSPAATTAATGVPFSYQVTATNGPTSFGAAGLPAGLAIDSTTGLISGSPQFFGTAAVTLTATNGTGTGSGTLTITISQSAVQVLSAPAVTGSIGTPFFYQVDVANGPASVTASAMPPGLTFDGVGQRITGTPTRGGTYTVNLAVSNTTGTVNFTLTITIGFQVATVADVAVDVVYETARAITLPITGDFTAVNIVTLPSHGLVSVQGNIATYTPALGYFGEDSFTYTATNPAGTTAAATVRISIGSLAPIASAAAMTVQLNTPATADLAGSIRASGLTGVSIGTQPSHGTVTVNGTQVTYTPSTDFFGADSFTYIAFGNAGKSTPAVVTVSVVGRPNPAEARDVGGIVDSQVQAARRFSSAQSGNIQRRMEMLHRGRDTPPRASDAPAAAVAPAPVAAAPEGADTRPVRVATTGLIPVSLFAPLLNAATTRSLDVAASTGGDGRGLASGTNIWAGGTGQFGRRDADGELSGLRFSTDGISVGIDRRLSERLVLGLGVGYGRYETTVGSNGSASKAKGYSFAFYGSFQPSVETFVDMLVGVGRIDFDSRRHVAAVDQFATGSRSGEQAFASLTAGAEFRRDGLTISPYGRIDVARDRLKAYSESGAGLYSLTYHEQRLNSSSLSMGVRAETQHDTDFGRVVPRLRLEYRRQLDGQHGASVSYADLFGGPEYSLGAAGTSRNALLLGVGSDFLVRGGFKLGVDYQAQRSSGTSNVQAVRLLVSQDLDGRGLPSWTWQPKMFKDPVGVEFGFAYDDNVSRGRTADEKLVDRAFSLSVGEPIPIKLGNLANLRLVVTPSLAGEKFQRYQGLGRFSAGAQAELQYRASGAFDATTFSLVGRANYDRFESHYRTGPRYFAGVNARRSLTDRIDVFAEVGANARDGRSDVFTTRDYAAKLNLDYTLGKRGVLYLAGEYRRGDTVSGGLASLENVGLAEVFVPDDAFEGHGLFAYRFDARTVLGTLGWNYPLGPRDSLDFSWRRVQTTPTHRPSFDGGGPLRYIDNQYSIVYLMRF